MRPDRREAKLAPRVAGLRGMFVVRFPHPGDPGDDGTHIDTTFPPDAGDANERSNFSVWRANARSRRRA
jgi:hypothetical protein